MAESSRSARDGSGSPRPRSRPPSTRRISQSPSQSPERRSASPDSELRDSRRGDSPSRSRSRSRSRSDVTMTSRSHSPPPRVTRQASGSSSDDRATNKRANKTALRLEHLTHNVRESHLHHIFGWYGQVERVHLKTGSNGGLAYVMMASVEQAAKAALYMSGGQVDGAIITIRTCVPPQDLPPERPRQQHIREEGRYDRSGRRDDRRRSSSKYDDRNEDAYQDRRGPMPRERDAGIPPSSRSIHPDRQQMLSGGDRGRHSHFQEANGHPKQMRKWGQPNDVSGQGSSRRRDRSWSRSRSPPSSPRRRRRSDAATRASPSY